MVILAKQKEHSLTRTLSKKKPKTYEHFSEGSKVKVVIQIELLKVTLEIKQEQLQCILKTDKGSFLLEFESPRDSKEWIAFIGDTRDKIEKINSGTYKLQT